jgi:D-alanyl-D-alanine carboxypeptidase/D-alanyl-D-alanine-endopeptidase (penicillin-binding protein 4)
MLEQERLCREIDRIINGPDYKTAVWGIMVVDLETGDTVYELNPDKLFKPASTTKLYSVAAALDVLGADYRFETPVYRQGEIDAAGVLHGDLILMASGDPTMGGRTNADGAIAFTDHDHTYGPPDAILTAPDPLAGLNELARQAAANGIKRIEGEVRVDDRLFDKETGTGSGPSRLTPIIVNDNLIDLIITPGAEGEFAAVTTRPETAAWLIDARIETVAQGQKTTITLTSPLPGRLVAHGQIAVDSGPRVEIFEVEDAAAFARALFIEALQRQGIRVNASPLNGNDVTTLPAADACAALPRVALLTSPPFSEEARLILKVSHNLHAGVLPMLLAVRQGKRSLAEGLELQRAFLERLGVDTEAASFGSAAGGSDADWTTPRATVQLLRAMANHRDFAAYHAALPTLGVDGTLAKAVDPDSPARARVAAKTGTLVSKDTMNDRYILTSKTLAGYLTSASQRRCAFAMLMNTTPIRELAEIKQHGRTLGRLCEVLYLDV